MNGKARLIRAKNDDSALRFITIDPAISGFEFVAGERGGKRALVIRDRQHKYVFTEVA